MSDTITLAIIFLLCMTLIAILGIIAKRKITSQQILDLMYGTEERFRILTACGFKLYLVALPLDQLRYTDIDIIMKNNILKNNSYMPMKLNHISDNKLEIISEKTISKDNLTVQKPSQISAIVEIDYKSAKIYKYFDASYIDKNYCINVVYNIEI